MDVVAIYGAVVASLLLAVWLFCTLRYRGRGIIEWVPLRNLCALWFGVILLGLLAYSFRLAIGAPLEARPMAFATIATGIALAAVAYLTYRLQKRAFDLSHDPLLGIILMEPLRVSEIKGDIKKPVIVEFLLWNAGDVPILVLEPNLVPIDRTLPDIARQELVLIALENLWREQGFPIVLGKGTLCIWRIFTGDTTYFVSIVGYTIGENKERAISWIKAEPKSGETARKYLFEIIYTSGLPARLQREHLKRQYVGFYYGLD